MGLFSKAERDSAMRTVNKELRKREDTPHCTVVKENGSFSSYPALTDGRVRAFGQMYREDDGRIGVSIISDDGRR